MAGDARVLDAGPRAFFGEHVAVADAAGLDLDEDVAGGGLGDFALDDLEVCSGAGDLCGFHCCHELLLEFWIVVVKRLDDGRRRDFSGLVVLEGLRLRCVRCRGLRRRGWRGLWLWLV